MSAGKLKGKEKEPLKLVGLHGESMVEVFSMQPKGDGIYIKTRILGGMSYTICLKPEEMVKAIELINWPIVRYVLRKAIGLRKEIAAAIITKLSFWRKESSS